VIKSVISIDQAEYGGGVSIERWMSMWKA